MHSVADALAVFRTNVGFRHDFVDCALPPSTERPALLTAPPPDVAKRAELP